MLLGIVPKLLNQIEAKKLLLFFFPNSFFLCGR